MYVIATVFCSNFHFSVSLHVPFSQFLFERDSYSNAYLLAKFGFDTAENEPCQVCPTGRGAAPRRRGVGRRGAGRGGAGRGAGLGAVITFDLFRRPVFGSIVP